MAWQVALNKGLLPDEICLQQIIDEGVEDFAAGRQVSDLKWPEEPLHTLMIRCASMALHGTGHPC